jgi:hypothetical protein
MEFLLLSMTRLLQDSPLQGSSNLGYQQRPATNRRAYPLGFTSLPSIEAVSVRRIDPTFLDSHTFLVLFFFLFLCI